MLQQLSPLSDHYIMLIRPQQALPLARNNSKLLIFNKIIFVLVSYIFKAIIIYLTHWLKWGLKLALLHRVKERKTPSLSAQASFAPFSLKVAWSAKSLSDTSYPFSLRLPLQEQKNKIVYFPTGSSDALPHPPSVEYYAQHPFATLVSIQINVQIMVIFNRTIIELWKGQGKVKTDLRCMISHGITMNYTLRKRSLSHVIIHNYASSAPQ